jgi:hypothetical protein
MGCGGKVNKFGTFDRDVPLDPVLKDGVKGHNIKGDYLAGKPRPLGRRASLWYFGIVSYFGFRASDFIRTKEDFMGHLRGKRTY